MHAPITSKNRHFGMAVDGQGGIRESHQNNILEESFPHVRGTGRQAQALPQNLEAWCPGSLRTNWEKPHPRAGVTQPTSADLTMCEIGSWLDHPRSYYDNLVRAPTEQIGPPSRRKVEAASGTAKILKSIYDDCGFYFGSSAIKTI